MFENKGVMAFLVGIILLGGVCFSEGLKDDWNDFLHYTTIGRLDLAKGYAQKIIDSNPEPTDLLALSQSNPEGYRVLLRLHANSDDLQEVSGQILDIIEKGRFELSTEPRIINQEIKRLSTTIRGRIAAEQRLKDAGEYAVPFMLDALADERRSSEFANITAALPKIGRQAIRPLAAALQTGNVAVKSEVIRALGEIGYPQALGYLQYVVEKDPSDQLKEMAKSAINKIDPSSAKLPAAELLFQLAEKYYYHADMLAASEEFDFANIWFWDEDQGRLTREEVKKEYFNELMAMRCCEWALMADQNIGKAIALWIAAFFKAESYGIQQPAYFGDAHPDAMTYATTSGPEYLHQALERAIEENNGFVALGVVEALAANAGEKSLMYRIGTQQPLAKALSFNDRAVRYSAAIAVGQAGPVDEFTGYKLIIENLAEAITDKGLEDLGRELTDAYALRSINVMLQLAVTGNTVIDLNMAQDELIGATKDPREVMQVISGQTLARMPSPDAQRAIADMAISEDNSQDVRIKAFNSLAISAKINAKLLTESQIDAIYSLIESDLTDPVLKSAAASAYGALNLPSMRVKDLILGQAKS